jgi:hypothetical protein
MSLLETAQILGNLGEFVSAVVIVATLIYLAMQIRQNSEQLAAQSRYNNYKGRSDLTLVVALNDELLEIWFKSINDDQLSPTEQMRFNFFTRSVFTFWEYEFHEYEAGRLNNEEFNPAGKRRVFERNTEIWDRGWTQYKTTAPRRFVEFVDENIVNQPIAE